MVLGGCGRRVVLLLEVPGRKIDRRVLATDMDAELWLATCVSAHPRADSRTGSV